MTAVVALVAAVGAAMTSAALLTSPGHPAAPPSGWRRAPAAGRIGVLAASGVSVVLVLGGGAVAPAIVAAVLLVVGGRWRTRRARDRVAATRRAEVRAWCEHLAGDLAAGRPAGAALEDAAQEWPLIAPVACAAAVGADLPGAWREVAAVPGAERLEAVAAAWQVAGRTGAGLAAILDDVARALRADDATRVLVEGELASARATGRLVAALAPLALLMGQGLGGDPLGLLIGTPLGIGCLGLGGGLLLLGLAWIERLARDALD